MRIAKGRRMTCVDPVTPEGPADNGLSAVAQAIRRYIEAHPNAADSVDGILHWWLTRQHYTDAVRDVQDALDQLVARGLISCQRLSDGRVVYQRAPTAARNDK
jgi:hypothetical protein